jgi:hypothetical protein
MYLDYWRSVGKDILMWLLAEEKRKKLLRLVS